MLEPGSQLGRYEIQRRLGRGGMGTVYVAHDPVLGRMVAIKVFAGELDFPDARERFSREARSAAALSHPNIVTVFDFGEFDSQPYIVMEYVPGETLAAVIRRKAEVATADKLRWIEELCSGAGYAHEKSVIHRDIKPANLMIDRAGRLKILDFGIARMMGAASNTTAMIGTPGYMAPEQIEGKPADHRADLFSIGVVFYELLAYTDAFPGETIPTITHRILTEDPVPLTHLVPDADPGVVELIERALKKNVADRFESADSMRTAIGRLRRQFDLDVTSIRPADAPRRDAPPARPGRGTGSARNPSSVGAGVASLTPPPERMFRDREALARLRVAYLETALESARTLFEQNQLPAALAACQQALAYDETNAAALDLAQRIEDAMLEPFAAPPDAADLGDSAPAAGSPVGFEMRDAGEVRHTPADRTVLKPVVRTPRPSAAPVMRRPSEPPMPAADATIIAPSRRTPPPAPAVPTPAAPVPAARTGLPPVAKGKPATPDLRARLRAMSASLAAALPALPALPAMPPLSTLDFRQLDRRKALVWGGAGVLAIALLSVGIMTMAGGPAPTGTLILDALPWATVSAVVGEDGEPQRLPSPASTPLALALPAGNYEVVLVGPPPESQERRVSVRVDADAAVAMPIVRFRPVTPEEYFEQYLAPPGEGPLAPELVPAAPLGSTPVPGVSQ